MFVPLAFRNIRRYRAYTYPLLYALPYEEFWVTHINLLVSCYPRWSSADTRSQELEPNPNY
uniref:Uncharacterized protein n=1 Tax=Picea sitchensis TaxID=3332 RepID=A0A6B9XWF4_PICSI|nr:hypothetical protein Q903MT_gene4379 [Picea sitchensis]